MKVTRISKLPIKANRIQRSVCVGVFDGLHLGHQQLVAKTLTRAKKAQLTSAMFTFDPSPKNFLLNKNFPYLLSLKSKIRIAKELGLDEIIILDFNKKIADLSPDHFIEKIIKPLNIRSIIVGYDFSYGNKGIGKASTLLKLNSKDFKVDVIKEIVYKKEKISSTRVHQALASGSVKLARLLLSRHYTLEGVVIRGKGNGKKIGFPTANLDIGDYALPKSGVYAVKVGYKQKSYLGMANIGTHPTIMNLSKPLLEVNIFEFNKDIYGEELSIEFVDYIRDEQKFPSVQALIKQLNKDKINISRLLKRISK
jgi:riboflavin kinase/FMN adenylyltransferase